jgi:hypothetical protein
LLAPLLLLLLLLLTAALLACWLLSPLLLNHLLPGLQGRQELLLLLVLLS